MLYETTIRYGRKEISFKFSKKFFSGIYELPDFLRRMREYNNVDYETAAKGRKYTAEEFEQMEKGEIPITQEFLRNFIADYYLPKKIARLGIESEPDAKSELADRIYQLRMTRGNKTQEETAHLINVSRTAYAGYESGRSEPDLQTLVKIAEVYGVSLDYLAGRY